MKKSILSFILLVMVCAAQAGMITNNPEEPAKGAVLSAKTNKNIVYVDSAGTGDGSSWENATSDLQAAINMYDTAQIWVAAGTYIPHDYPAEVEINTKDDSSRCLSFYMKNNIALYGGFSGTEDTLTERDWETNITILSGDLGVTGESSDNSYHVILNTNLDTSAILNGFVITDGVADGDYSGSNRNGGALYSEASSPKIQNCHFIKNSADYGGGAIYNKGISSPFIINCTFTENNSYGGGAIYIDAANVTVENCKFEDNKATVSGGALYMKNSESSISKCEFISNVASDGGALYIDSNKDESFSPKIISCLFEKNKAREKGGAAFNNDGAASDYVNCIFDQNIGANAGGLFNNFKEDTDDNKAQKVISVVNCTFVGNESSGTTENPGGISGIGGPMVLANSILWQNIKGEYENDLKTNRQNKDIANVVFSISSNNLEMDDYVNKNYTIDPYFADSRYQINTNSPCANTGNTDAYTAVTNDSLDFSGRTRFAGNKIDMGAHEGQVLRTSSDGIMYVRTDGNWNGDGESWDNATNNLMLATQSIDSGQVWIAGGTYTPEYIHYLPIKETYPELYEDKYRVNHFAMKKNVAWHGGFAGNESADYDLDERDMKTNETILSGNIGDKNDKEDNCYQVISNKNVVLDSTAIIEGLTISDGYAETYSEEKGAGAGLYSQGHFEQIINCKFSQNYGFYNGIALYINGSGIKVMDCVFENNSTSDDEFYQKATIYNASNATFINCTIENNASTGMLNARSSLVNNCSFISNDGYGILSRNSNNTLTLVNSIFKANGLSGLYAKDANSKITNCLFTYNGSHGINSLSGICNITNSTFHKNNTNKNHPDYTNLGGNIYLYASGANDSASFVKNNICWGFEGTGSQNVYVSNNTQVEYNCIEGYSAGYKNINSDPLFVSGTDYSLQSGSPAIKRGNKAAYDSTLCDYIDLNGNYRLIDSLIDMGAYEYGIEHYKVAFEIMNADTAVTEAIVTFTGYESLEGDNVFEGIVAGVHPYTIDIEGLKQFSGNVIVDSNMTKIIKLDADTSTYTLSFDIMNGDSAVINGAVVILDNIVYDMNEYIIDSISAGTHTYTINAEGYKPMNGEVVVDSNTTESIVLEEITYAVMFSVIDSDSVAITGAVITIDNIAFDKDHYTFDSISQGKHTYTIKAEGYGRVAGEIIVDTNMTKTVMLTEGLDTYMVTFEITDGETPVTDAVITFNDTVYEKDDYTIEGVVIGAYNYLIDKEGYEQVAGVISVTSDTTEKVMLTGLVGLTNLNKNEINIYPNPFNNILNITNIENVNRIVVSDYLGRNVIDVKNDFNSDITINTEQLIKGIYIISIYENNKISSTIKLNKQ